MIKEAKNRMKNYLWPLVVLIFLGDFALSFCLLLLVIFFIAVFGGPAFSWLHVLRATLIVTFVQWIFFVLLGIEGIREQKKEKRMDDTWKK